MSDDDVKGLWRGLDDDASGEVTVQEFMVFMRRHGAAHSMHRLTEYAKDMRGLGEVREKLERVDLPEDRLRAISLKLQLIQPGSN